MESSVLQAWLRVAAVLQSSTVKPALSKFLESKLFGVFSVYTTVLQLDTSSAFLRCTQGASILSLGKSSFFSVPPILISCFQFSCTCMPLLFLFYFWEDSFFSTQSSNPYISDTKMPTSSELLMWSLKWTYHKTGFQMPLSSHCSWPLGPQPLVAVYSELSVA